jgi:hypothetical protein
MTARFHLKRNFGRQPLGAWRQDELIDGKPPVVKQLRLLESCSSEKWETDSWGRAQLGNPEERECPPLEATTKQRLLKTEKIIYMRCVTQWDYNSYL